MHKEPSKVTFLINSLGEGGAQRAIATLAKQLLKEGKKVTILSLANNDFYELPSEVKVVYFTNSVKDSMLLIPYYAWKLKRYVKKHHISNVQSYLFRANYVNLFSRLLGAKHRIQVANRSVVSRFFNEGFSGKINIFLIKRLYPKADLIIHQSERMKLDFHTHFNSNNPEQVIYNSFDVEAILSQAHQKVEGFSFDSNKRYLVIVGRLIALKRFQDVIRAMKHLTLDVELLILGDGKEQESLELLAKTLGLEKRVHFLGQVKNPFAYIKRSDIFISSSSVEGFPNVLVEAMLCKTVVISSDCISGPREIMAPSTDSSKQLLDGIEVADYGLLYPVGSVEDLNRAIQQLLEDTEQRRRLIAQAFERAQMFSVENIKSQYKKLFD
ncbi:glycosyltransferase [bacterium]|nr:glycosyltransferase [bacterium]MBU1959339.1 glycosyltransferase [bacterium]